MGDVSDSELDDLLDNALNDFDKTKEESAKAAKAAEPAPSSGVPKLINFDDEYDVERLMEDGIPGMENFMSSFEDALSGDVMKQMEETMRSFSQNPELAAMLEQMTREMGGTGLEDLFAGQASAGKSAGAAAKKPEVQEKKTGAAGKSAAPAGSFQDAIAGSVQQLEQSKEQSAAAAPAEGMDFMKMLEGGAGGEGMDSMMETMMLQLVSKDILYEPMKELNDKYPEWLSANESRYSVEQFAQYKRQHQITSEIITIYESNATGPALKRVMDLMQEMQESGQVPPEILQQIAPGMEMGPDGFPKIPGGLPDMGDPEKCTIM